MLVAALSLILVAFTARWVAGLDDPEPTPPHLVDQRRLVGIAIEDARFVEPISIGTVARRCTVGGFMADSSICAYEGVATFEPSADQDALGRHLEERGWTDNRAIQENDVVLPAYHRLVDGTDVCLSTDVRNGVLSVTTRINAMCVDVRPSEALLWDGWTLLVPDVPPAKLEVRTRSLDITDDVVTVALRHRPSDGGATPMVEVRERRLPVGALADDCYRAEPDRPSSPEQPLCRPLLTTPSGRAVLVDRAEPEPYGAPFVRRSWFVAIGSTVVEVERIDPPPAALGAEEADAQLVTLIDSLRPATYDEILSTFARDETIEPAGIRYDEPHR